VGAAQDGFNAMLRDHVAPALRDMGFKGSGKAYRLDDEQCWIQLGFQASVSSTADAVRFTINLRVVAKDVWDRMREERSYMPARPAPNVVYGPFEWWQRIGRLMPGGQDTWWTLKAGQPGACLAGEVIDAIRDYALPAMLAQRQLVNQG
jgi:hypothetical protein